MDMEIEGGINNFENDWWYEFGISFHRTKYNKYKRVFTISLIIYSIYIRW
jgi:hypothetical protein